MNDLDLLVHPEDLFKTIKLIKRLGYEQEKITHHAVLRGGQERRVAIEVHWCLPPNNISRNNQALLLFWGESKPHPVYKSANIFSPNHQLLYLAAHLLGSGGEGRLVHWYDIFEIIRVEEKNINWQEVINVSEMLNWGSLIYDLAHGLNKKFKLSIGHNQEFISSHNQNRYVINYSEYIQQAFGLIRLSDKLKLLFGFIFPSSKYLLWKYHSKNVLSVPILFIRRLMGLFKKY
jgi:hypothetical protein